MISEIEFILFDLDNTLYPRESGLFEHVDHLINRYLEEVVKIPSAEVDQRRRAYWQAHGTTLNGLMLHHGVDPYHYLDFVHKVPLEDYLEVDEKLAEMIAGLPGDKYIFSNASNEHCHKVLDYLGLGDLFIAVYDINYFDFRPKPERIIYQELLDDIGGKAENGIMIDDMAVNLEPAASLGMTTILYDPSVTNSSQLPPKGRTLGCLHQFPQLIADLMS
ncbi:MAG: pyrimidine 5'-nucleotidase [Deltaproteobacteria bacterium]|nr:MAG: pyrimidine 5'-nucleotidase [Deltaproteobacteria bacterium]